MANRTIEAILRLSSKLGNMAAFRQLSGHLDKVDRQAKAYNRRQSMIAAGARDMSAALVRYAAPAALAYGAKQAYVEFAEIERRMTRIGITAGSSAEETREAFELLQRSAKDFALPIDAAVEGLDTLVSSGLNLKDAMAFLPSVLATAQAAGASTTDIANTAQKAASALKIEAAEMQRAFDIMVTGGKAGQFELKDMAIYIPELANSFASLGYEGEDGLKRLVAILQTIREDTGSAGAAATQAQNIFGKMYSEATAKKFADFGINLRKSLAEAKSNGEGALDAFVRLAKEAVDGDLSKLPLLFTDQEFRLGMQSLMTSADSYKRFIDAVNNTDVDGSTLRDLGVVLADNQAKIDRMAASWSKLKNVAGAAMAPAIGGGLDFLSTGISKGDAINAQLEKEGMGWLDRRGWWARNGFDVREQDDKAWRGGYRSEAQRRAIDGYRAYGKSRATSALPPAGTMPVPSPRPVLTAPAPTFDQEYARQNPARPVPPSPQRFAPGASPRDAERESMAALRADPNGVADAIDVALSDGSRRVAESGAEAGTAIAEAARAINEAGGQAGSTFAAMVKGMGRQIGEEAAAAFKRNVGTVTVRAAVAGGGVAPSGRNTGLSMPGAGE